MAYLSVAYNNMGHYLNTDINHFEDIQDVIINEFRNYLIEKEYSNLGINEFKELFLDNDFKKRLIKNPIYYSYILHKENKNKIISLENKLNYLLFVFICGIIKNLLMN
jgi:hypothetical protein